MTAKKSLQCMKLSVGKHSLNQTQTQNNNDLKYYCYENIRFLERVEVGGEGASGGHATDHVACP